MFCSKCGKTLKPDVASCPFCGEVVGDSRFEGNGYTAAQLRYASGESAEEARKAIPYTRTTYTTSVEDGGQDGGGDVYSRTTYRPILQEAPAQEPSADAQPEPGASAAPKADDDNKAEPATGESGTPRKEAASPAVEKRDSAPVATPQSLLPADDEGEDDGIVIAPLRPIKKTGISPEVQQYMERMNRSQPKPKRSLRDMLSGGQDTQDDEPETEAPMAAAASPITGDAPDGDQSDPLGVMEQAVPDTASAQEHQDSQPSAKRAAPAWLKPAGIIASIALILCVAVWALLNMFANNSILDGVGYNLRAEGLKLIKSETEPVFRNQLLVAMQGDTTGTASAAIMDAKRAEIEALKPESPLANDGLFIDTLLNIHELIENASGVEYFAVAMKNDPELGAGYETQAQDLWDEVTNAVTRLETATEGSQLQSIINGTKAASATPSPTPEPTPTPNTNPLKRGMNNNARVKKLQTRLKELGWFLGTIDSDFGIRTEQSVKRFKQAAGITPDDGIVDYQVWEAIFAEDALTHAQFEERQLNESTPTLVPGETTAPGDVDVGEVLDEAATS